LILYSSRSIPHEEFADYLRGRFYLSPSRLYSAIRLLPDKKGYDVPVPGDWITVAVVAERGPIKFTRSPVTIEAEDGDNKSKSKNTKGKSGLNESEKTSGKKYVNIKLIDFGARSSSTTGGASVIRGDAFLTLLLFESDGFDLIPRGNGMKPEKLYKGGSRGAFEHLTDVKEGDVIALLNPKILKPFQVLFLLFHILRHTNFFFQRSSDKPHPVDNVLALTPESASSIMVIGRSRDLGMCTVRKQDGKICGSWCDKRVSEVCDYHVQNAVQRRRAARPEFSIG
jgi:minichromosome maintenance protein 10